MMKQARFLLPVAWLLFAASFLVPLHNDLGTVTKGQLPGWEAIFIALTAEGPWRWLAILSALTNIEMLATLVVLRYQTVVVTRTFAVLSALATIVDASWFGFLVHPRTDLRIGYYMWWLSFAFALVSFVLLTRSSRVESQPALAG